ncbi:MAG: OsmC family protein [Schleiferiaceae bacterium]|nr:OsmC family protein [Schleiferiaceae bacterium]
MEISLERTDNNFGMKAIAGHHEIMLDSSPEEEGGSNKGATPMQLMLIALAGCSTIDIVHILRKGRYEITSYESEVIATRREEMPRIFNEITLMITLATDAPDEVLNRAVLLTKTKYCSAFAVLEASCPIGISVNRKT